VTTKWKKREQVRAIFSLVGVVIFAFLVGGCAADVQYANTKSRSTEAKYNTLYMPDYYPYYPWDGYYGGAYYYGE